MNNKLNLEAEPFEYNPEFDEISELFDSEIFEEDWEEEVTKKRRKPARPSGLRMRTVKPRRPLIGTFRPPKPRLPLFRPRVTGIVIRPPVVYREPPTKPPVDTPSERTPHDRPSPTNGPPESAPATREGSEYVRWVQSSLNRIMGLNLPLDGVMGTETRSAIRSFQEQKGLPVDGIVGPETEKALIDAKRNQVYAVAEPTSQSEFKTLEMDEFEWEEEVNRSSREYAMWVQASLNKILGLRLAVDGIVGPLTRSAIRSFQQRYGLLVDGIVGPQTEGALIAAGAGNPPGSGASPYIPPSTPTQPPAFTASRARLAQQILNNSRITLGASSSTPNGNPRQNIIDTANGRHATSGCYDFSKCGSTVYLSTKMLQALLTLANDGNSFYVTSFAGGRHGSGSDHYAGRAVDIGIWNGTSLSSPNSAHTAARNTLIAAGSSSSQTFNAYHDPDGNHKNHVHAAFY